jgi:hypothetical protein
MAEPIHNREQLAERYQAAVRRPPKTRPEMFGLLVFDERRSHEVVQDFARGQFRWLDSLARRAKMVLFLPVHPGIEQRAAREVGDDVMLVNTHESFENPSLEVAARFDIRVGELPGLLFFSHLDLEGREANAGVYWPLSLELFEGPAEKAEREFSELFDFVHDAQRGQREPADLLHNLKSGFESLERKRKRQPIFAAIREGLLRVVRFPGALVESMGIAYAEESARRMASPEAP